ncbi:MAG: hypothetical protein AAB355_02505 [Patescibacteria group bacterium]
MNLSDKVVIKQRAIRLRKRGLTYNYIEKKLGIRRSTLDYWLNGLELTPKALSKIKRKKIISLQKARAKAVIWHNEQKQKRLNLAKHNAKILVSHIRKTNNVMKLALAILYMGEGFKSIEETGLGSSDPLILRFFIKALRKLYGLKSNNFRCQLSLRMDQNAEKTKAYWSKELNLPLSTFMHVFYDKRAIGRTYPSYKGVCQVRCGNVAIQRELVWISKLYCASILNTK